jgi:methionyl-tRNA formyltransferase
MKSPIIAFFGTPSFATAVLDELAAAGMLPSLIITAPDAPKGRKLILTPPEVKVWAEEKGIPVLQPTTLKNEVKLAPLLNTEWDLFVVAAYGKKLPAEILALPKHGTFNVHPSLLPKLRGASPVCSAILADVRETGVSIMLVDEALDHGPIVAQARVELEESEWPPRATLFEQLLAHAGGSLLAETIPLWVEGKITPEEQNHEKATFSQKITKDMGEINLTDDPYKNLLKIRAYDGWPGTYFMHIRNGKDGEKNMRVKILDAKLAEDGTLQILRVVPEGKKEMDYNDFLRRMKN